MGVIAKYKFNSSTYADFIPVFNNEFIDYTITDVDNGDNTITRTISHDTLKPSLIRFGTTSSVTDRERSLLEVIECDTSNVTNMSSMFNRCLSLVSLDVSNFDTGNVTSMRAMFYNCNKLTSLDLSSFNTSKVTDTFDMFSECSSLISLDLSSFNTSNVTSMGYMFYNCSKLTTLDISNFNTSKVITMDGMLQNCSSLKSIGLLYATSTTINSLLTRLGTFTARNIYYLDAAFSELTAQTNINYIKYQESKASANVVLRKVGNVQDELDLETGKLTKNTFVMDDLGNYDMPLFTIHDGTYDSVAPVLKISFKLPVTAVDTGYGATSGFPLICDKFKVRGDENGYSENRGTYVSTRNGQLFLHLIKEEVGLPTDVIINKSHVQNYFKDNPIKIIYITRQPIIEMVDVSIIDQDNNSVKTIQTHPTLTHISTSSQGLIPNIVIPRQLKYPTIIKPSTIYTVQLKHTTVNNDNPLTINLGGTTMTVPSTKFTITTPETLTSQDVVFTGKNNVIGEVVITEGDTTNRKYNYFKGMKDVNSNKFIVKNCPFTFGKGGRL